MLSTMPAGPRQTASISFGPGRQVATASHSAATAAGVSTHSAPAASSFSALARRRSCTRSRWPAFSNWPAIGIPILPVPINPMFIGNPPARLQRMPSPPFRAEREGPVAQRREGEVGHRESTVLPPPHPNPLRPQGRRGSFLSGVSQRVEADGVVPQDLLLALVAQRQREEAVHRL